MRLAILPISSSLLLLRSLCLTATLAGSSSLIIVVVVVVVGLEDALSEFLLPPVDIVVEFVAVLSDREFLVVINGNVDAARTNRLVFRVVELGNVGVSQGLLSGQSSIRVKLKEVTEKIDGVVTGGWEHISQASCLRRWQRFEHCWS